jgi:restriction endonuclease S subunit
VFIARIGFSAGKALYFDSEEVAVYASYLIRVVFNDKLLPKFFWYFTQSEDYHKQRTRLFTGGAQPHFNADSIGQIEVPLPSIEEQRKIVAQLDREFAQIDAIRALSASYEGKTFKILNRLWNGKQGDIDAPENSLLTSDDEDEEDENDGEGESERADSKEFSALAD